MKLPIFPSPTTPCRHRPHIPTLMTTRMPPVLPSPTRIVTPVFPPVPPRTTRLLRLSRDRAWMCTAHFLTRLPAALPLLPPLLLILRPRAHHLRDRAAYCSTPPPGPWIHTMRSAASWECGRSRLPQIRQLIAHTQTLTNDRKIRNMDF